MNPTYKPYWNMPGGMAEINEPSRAAAERELREPWTCLLGVSACSIGNAPTDHGDDLLMLVFDGGTLGEEATSTRQIRADELRPFTFVSIDDARKLLQPYVWERFVKAVDAKTDRMRVYEEVSDLVPRR